MAREADLRPVIRFLLFMLAVFGVAFIGFLGAMRGIPLWYDGLLHPPGTPPAWVFGPVWTILYLLIGTAGWIISGAEAGGKRTLALTLFWTQLLLNGLWSWLFFGFQKPLLGLVEIAILWLTIFFLILGSRRSSMTAAWLLVPYLLWVSYASYLNFGIWSMNFRGNQYAPGRVETIINPS